MIYIDYIKRTFANEAIRRNVILSITVGCDFVSFLLLDSLFLSVSLSLIRLNYILLNTVLSEADVAIVVVIAGVDTVVVTVIVEFPFSFLYNTTHTEINLKI